MQITQLHQATFNWGETILCATILSANEWVMLLSNGNVYRWDAAKNSGVHLFDVNQSGFITYPDGGFDKTEKCIMYAMDDTVVVANEFKLHAFVYHPTIGRPIRLQREDYYAEHSSYPIALFKNDVGVPHLIYSVAWNHLQIINLDTRQILTADKSLIEVNAEQRHIDFYSKHEEHNKLLWPRHYDYFFGQLSMSPDNKYFMSRGWDWGSIDSYKVYDLGHFISSNRILDKQIEGWQHCNRPACWVDETTVAVAYNAKTDTNDDWLEEGKTDLLIYDIGKEESEIVNRFVLDIWGELYYSKSLGVFIAFDKKNGLVVCSRDGEIILKEETFKPDSFNPESNVFMTIENTAITINQLS